MGVKFLPPRKILIPLIIILVIIFVSLILLELLNLISGSPIPFSPQTAAGKLANKIANFTKTSIEKTSEKLFGISAQEGLYKIIGKKSELGGLTSFVGNFIIGLFAGLIVTVMAGIKRFMDEWASEPNFIFNSKPFFTDLRYTFIGRVVMFSFIFATAMQITFINQILKLIMFFGLIPVLLRPFVITVYFYYGPAVISYLIETRKEQKAMENTRAKARDI